MAIVFKNIGVRALSAAVFVLLLIGCLFWNYASFTIFFFVMSVMGLTEFYRLCERAGVRVFHCAGVLFGIITYLAFVRWDFLCGAEFRLPRPELLSVGTLAILALGFLKKNADPFRSVFLTIGGVFYVVVSFALLHTLVVIDVFQPVYTWQLVFGIILLIWANDTFAYLWGSLLGKRKLLERVSPGKTWEGTILGALTTFTASFIVRGWDGYSGGIFWPLMGLLVPVVATLGDLAESHLKRMAGVKDSGRIMPGHGGVLDRFDSLLFVGPFVVLIVRVVEIFGKVI